MGWRPRCHGHSAGVSVGTAWVRGQGVEMGPDGGSTMCGRGDQVGQGGGMVLTCAAPQVREHQLQPGSCLASVAAAAAAGQGWTGSRRRQEVSRRLRVTIVGQPAAATRGQARWQLPGPAPKSARPCSPQGRHFPACRCCPHASSYAGKAKPEGAARTAASLRDWSGEEEGSK